MDHESLSSPSTPDGDAHVYVQTLDGSAPRRINAQESGLSTMPKWSADGKWLYHYFRGQSAGWRRTRISEGKDDGKDDGTTEVIVAGWEFSREHDATIDPSGRLAAYALIEGKSIIATEVKDLTSGSEKRYPHQISWLDWSTDGRTALGTDFSSDNYPVGRIVKCAMREPDYGKCTAIAERGQHPVWSSDERQAYFVRPLNANEIRVLRYSFEDESTTVVADLQANADMGPFIDVTATGKIVWVKFERGRSELWSMSR